MQPSTDSLAPITLAELRAARERIRGTILETPLVPLRAAGHEIWLKLENLQPINAFKIRGAANAVFSLDDEQRARGVWTISAGNAGQGVAFAARAAGVPCTVVTIDTAPDTKVRRMRDLGARLVKAPFDACWEAMEKRRFPGVEGTFVHPFDDRNFIAGNASVAMEIFEQLPAVKTVVAAVGGGGLLAGIGTAARALRPDVRVYGAEPETAAPLALSLERGSPQKFERWQATFVDGAGGKSLFPRMWERLLPLVDGSIVVTLDEVRAAMRTAAEQVRIICEGAGALPVAAALAGRAGDEPVVAVVSGGNIDLATFCQQIATVG
ncbi:MAG TPA: threonine/serine dehydratase [Thermoanaerobaculia bacterium]|jgi:threonine dehydratase|nr:threonine/serine dehydratase [Thermoanaerobaculia bacterium]